MACARIGELLAEYAEDRHGVPTSLLRRTRSQCGCADCSTVYSIAQVRHVIERMLAAECAEPPSPEGFRLALARLGLLGKRAVDEWTRHELAEIQHAERALLAWVRGKLPPLQLCIVRLAYDPIGCELREWYVSLGQLEPLAVPLGEDDGENSAGETLKCGAMLKSGGSCRNAREAGQPRCKRHYDANSRPATWITKREGAELVQLTSDGRAARVKGRRALHRSPQQIGELLELRATDVTRLLTAAYETIRILPHVGLLTHGN